MNLTTLTQQVSDTTHIGQRDILMIMNKAFSILAEGNTTQTLTIPQYGSSPEFSLLISKI